jgi:hypothetical protein
MLRIDAERLRDELFKRGVCQRDAAQGAGISEFTLSRAVNGAGVRPSTMRRLAGYLAATPEIPAIATIAAEKAATERYPRPMAASEEGRSNAQLATTA